MQKILFRIWNICTLYIAAMANLQFMCLLAFTALGCVGERWLQGDCQVLISKHIILHSEPMTSYTKMCKIWMFSCMYFFECAWDPNIFHQETERETRQQHSCRWRVSGCKCILTQSAGYCGCYGLNYYVNTDASVCLLLKLVEMVVFTYCTFQEKCSDS